MNLLTIVVIAVFVVFMIIGYMRGLLRSVFKLIIAIAAMCLSYILAPLVANLIMDYTPIDNYVNDKVYESLEDIARNRIKKEVGENIGEVGEEVIDGMAELFLSTEPTKNQQIEIIKQMKLPKFMEEALINNNNDETKEELGVDGFFKYVAYYISYMIIKVLSFFVTFVLFEIGVHIIYIALGIVTKLPVVGSMDKIGGLSLGALEALALVWVFMIVISVFANTEFGRAVSVQINESGILTFLDEHNILNSAITKIR